MKSLFLSSSLPLFFSLSQLLSHFVGVVEKEENQRTSQSYYELIGNVRARES
jgi:hypothetical protein